MAILLGKKKSNWCNRWGRVKRTKKRRLKGNSFLKSAATSAHQLSMGGGDLLKNRERSGPKKKKKYNNAKK